MKKLLIFASLALTTACASSPPMRATTQRAARPDSSVQPKKSASEMALAGDDLNTWQQMSVETAKHLAEAQPGELGMSLRPAQAAEPEQVVPRRAIARPKLVSKRSRARLFVLPTRGDK